MRSEKPTPQRGTELDHAGAGLGCATSKAGPRNHGKTPEIVQVSGVFFLPGGCQPSGAHPARRRRWTRIGSPSRAGGLLPAQFQVNAVLLEHQIEVRVGEPARAPVLQRHDLPRLRREFEPKGATPGAVGEDLRARPRFLDRGPEFPRLVVAGAPAMMRREERLNARGTTVVLLSQKGVCV